MSDCQRQFIIRNYEPVHDKTNKMTCAQRILRSTWASAQSDQSFRCLRKESLDSLVTLWAHSEDSDQTGLMPRLIGVFAGCTGHFYWFCHAAAHIWATSHMVCDQLRLKPACSATETSLGLEISAIASRGIVLFRQRISKAVIILCCWACWSSVWN